MNPEFTNIKNCKVCNSKKIINLDDDRSFYLENLDQTVTLPYSICANCHFIFQASYVGDKFLNHYYKHSPMLRKSDVSDYEISQNIRQSDFIDKHFTLKRNIPTTVLEIGAHAGAFLRHLNENYDCECYYDELSVDAKEILKSHGSLRDYNDYDKTLKCDLIVLRHVLEHIHNLEKFLNRIKNMLSENGVLFIEVPDWSHWDENTDQFIFEHLHQFNSFNLNHLLNRYGWKIEALEKSIDKDDPATPNRVLRVIAKKSILPLPLDKSIVQSFKSFALDYHEGWKKRLNKILKYELNEKKIALAPASHLTYLALTESNLKDADVVGMFDSNINKINKEVLGINIYSHEKIREFDVDIIIIFSLAYEPEIKKKFSEINNNFKFLSINDLIKKK